ncbi:MAG TPA: hypothetical protein VK911_15545, partial [Vicinamibacterales bacterium]|nr:hypothetical protein [Vicinamibacterales bacterium]
QALPQISAEFERARRYERTLTVAVFTGSAEPKGGSNGGKRGRSPGDDRALGGVLASAIREIDLVTCHPAAGCCVVMMPEIGPEEGRRAVGRMRELCARRLNQPISTGIAVFPQDGWLFLDLVDLAQRHARCENESDTACVSDERLDQPDRSGPPLTVQRAQGA